MARSRSEAGPVEALGERLSELHAQKEAAVEAVLARLGPLEARLAGLEGRDPQAPVDRSPSGVGTLEGAGDRIAALAERLGGLHAQKDAAVEAVLGQLAPLEARLPALEAPDPQGALDGSPSGSAVQGRLAGLGADAVRGAHRAAGRASCPEGCAVEAVFGRLAPLEARLAALEGGLARVLPLAEDDPRAAVEGLPRGSRRCTGRRARWRPGSRRCRRPGPRAGRWPASPTS